VVALKHFKLTFKYFMLILGNLHILTFIIFSMVSINQGKFIIILLMLFVVKEFILMFIYIIMLVNMNGKKNMLRFLIMLLNFLNYLLKPFLDYNNHLNIKFILLKEVNFPYFIIICFLNYYFLN